GEMRLRCVRDDARERRLPGARRPVEDERRDLVGFDGAPQQLAAPEDVLLPDELIQCPRPHAISERRLLRLVAASGVFEEVGHGAAGWFRAWCSAGIRSEIGQAPTARKRRT